MKNYIISAAVFMTAATSAHAAGSVGDNPPRCSAQVECERMWINAQKQIEMITGMRIRTVTDGRITTFAPTGPGQLGGEVVKYPIDEHTYELRSSFECFDRGMPCNDLAASATKMFNAFVSP